MSATAGPLLGESAFASVPAGRRLQPPPVPPSPRGWHRVDPALLVLLLLPVALVWIYPGWMFGNWVCDAWFYFGFYHDLPSTMRHWGDSYYLSRLSALLPGYILYELLPPVLANYVLHFLLYYTSVLSFYWVAKQCTGRRAALVAAILLGTFVHFLHTISTDYVESYGVAYILLTLLGLTMALRTSWARTGLVIAGAAACSLVVAQILYVLLLPGLAAYYLLGCRLVRAKRLDLVGSVGYALVGVGLACALYGGFNWWVTGDAWFLRSQVDYVWNASTRQGVEGYKIPWEQVLPNAHFLIFPVLAAVAAPLTLWRLRRDGAAGHPLASLSPAYFLVTLGTLLVGELHPSVYCLRYSIYVSQLLPAVFLALAGYVAPLLQRLTRSEFVCLVLCVLFLAFVPMVWPAPTLTTVFAQYSLPRRLLWIGLPLTALVIWQAPRLPWLPATAWRQVAALSCVALLVAVYWPKLFHQSAWVRDTLPQLHRPVGALVLGLFGIALLAVGGKRLWVGVTCLTLLAGTHFMAYPHRTPRNFTTCDNAEGLAAVSAAVRILHEEDPNYTCRLWCDGNDPQGGTFVTLIASSGWSARGLNTGFPAKNATEDESTGRAPRAATPWFWVPLRVGQTICLITTEGDALERARASVRAAGWAVRVVKRRQVRTSERAAFDMIFCDIVDEPARAGSSD